MLLQSLELPRRLSRRRKRTPVSFGRPRLAKVGSTAAWAAGLVRLVTKRFAAREAQKRKEEAILGALFDKEGHKCTTHLASQDTSPYWRGNPALYLPVALHGQPGSKSPTASTSSCPLAGWPAGRRRQLTTVPNRTIAEACPLPPARSFVRLAAELAGAVTAASGQPLVHWALCDRLRRQFTVQGWVAFCPC